MYESELKEAVNLLMDWRNTNPNEVAVDIASSRIDEDMTQTKVRRVAINSDKGGSKDPKPNTVLPIAKYFGLQLHEIYDLDFVKAYILQNGDRASLEPAKDGPLTEELKHFQYVYESSQRGPEFLKKLTRIMEASPQKLEAALDLIDPSNSQEKQ